MRRREALALFSVAGVLGVSACANPDDGATNQKANSGEIVTSTKKDDAIAAMLPDSIKEKGVITASINAEVAPVKFVDSSGKVTGLNPELLRAAAQVLGVEVTFKKGTFDAMVPGLESNRYDLIASIGDYAERQTNIDFIDYLQNGTAVIAQKDLEQSDLTPETFCGLSIGYVRGNVQQGYLEKAVEACAAAGKPELKINGYGDAGAALLSVKSSEADGFWGDLPQMAFNVKNSPDVFKLLYTEQKGVLGIGIRKDNPELRDALQAALLKLVENGVYEDLLQEWGLAGTGIPDMPLNSKISIKD